MANKKTRLKGDVFLSTGSEQSFSASQIALLQAIDHCGSISKAAKEVGISYKTAWDRIDAMNNLSNTPLATRSAGGAHGGGTVLTAFGKQIVEGFLALQEEHTAFVEQLGHKLHSFKDVANFVRGGAMKTSARNQFRGEITAVTPGAVNGEVSIDIGAGQTLTSIITLESIQHLGLQIGTNTIALVKSSSIILSTDIAIVTSARNKLIGTISRAVPGAVNSEITLDLGEGKSVCATITNTSVAELGLQTGQKACALFKASSVILLLA